MRLIVFLKNIKTLLKVEFYLYDSMGVCKVKECTNRSEQGYGMYSSPRDEARRKQWEDILKVSVALKGVTRLQIHLK